MKLTEAKDTFLMYCESIRKLSHHTIRAYRLDLTRFIGFAGDEHPALECDKALLQNYVRSLFDVHQLSAASVHRHIATLRSFFRWLTDQTENSVNPLVVARIQIRIPSRLPRVIPRADVRALLSEGECAPVRGDVTAVVAAELMFATGMRVSELSSLKDTDVDLDEGVLRILGKGNRERRVFIPDDDLKNILRRYRAARLASAPTAETFLVNGRGDRPSPQYIRRQVRELGKRAGVEKRITPHMLRHSVATYLLEEGVDIRYVQRLLGHRSITTTEIYTHVADATLKAIICERHPRNVIATTTAPH